MRIEITGLKVSEVNKLGDQIKGDWHIERIGDRIWLVADKEQNFIRIEDVKEVI